MENVTVIHRTDQKPATNVSGKPHTPGLLKTDARTATPNTPPSSHSALSIPDAIPVWWASTACHDSFATVGNAIEVPVPAMVSSGAPAGLGGETVLVCDPHQVLGRGSDQVAALTHPPTLRLSA